jgi:hypothetical protein
VQEEPFLALAGILFCCKQLGASVNVVSVADVKERWQKWCDLNKELGSGGSWMILL